MNLNQFGNNNQTISDYIYNNKESIPIVNVVKITPYLWGRLDIIINEYCDGVLEFLPILMDFNKLVNPFDLKIGQYLNIPDYQYVINSISLVDLGNIPGVNNNMDCLEVNKDRETDMVTANNNTGKSRTVAIPKLNVNLKKVSYDTSTGKIRF